MSTPPIVPGAERESDGESDRGDERGGDPTVSRRVGDYTITIDRLLCVGFGDCIEEAPEAFEFDDEGIAILTNPAAVEHDRLVRACEICPVDAITVTDATGREIVPPSPA